MGSHTTLDMKALECISGVTGSCEKEYWRRYDRKVSQRFMMVRWLDMLELDSTGPGNSLDEGSNRDSNVVQNISNWLTESYIIKINGQYRRAAFRKKILYAGWEVSILYAGRTQKYGITGVVQSCDHRLRLSEILWGDKLFKGEIIER